MRLKSLEIQGFKSFADRTVIEFQSGITGIVGPNGCGKSNIVDAIRWVMGEMSAKHLRGREMQDVIFSGSEGRSPASMAEVTLLLSNEDGRAPASYSSFSEISVSRRLYRSGDSEYFINKVPCRLRDIYDLFLGTGVGTKAYSIVEQGQIGLIITSKPEDRRRIIEEAAGISKFKAKKEAAFRKMEAAQNNLTRLEDILNELRRQISSLDRQAKKAEKYREIRDRARSLELHLSSLDFLTMNRELVEGENRMAQVSQQEAAFAADQIRLETDVETLRLQLEGEEQEINTSQERLYEKNNAISLHEQAVQYKARELKQLAEQEAACLKEIEEIKEKLKRADEELTGMNEEQLKVDLLKAQSDEDLKTFEDRVRQAEEKEKELERDLERLQQEVLQCVRVISEATSKQEIVGRQKIELKGRIGKNQAEIEEIDRQLGQFSPRLKQDQAALGDLNQLKLELTHQSGNVVGTLEREKTEFERLRNELSQLKDDLSRRRSRFQSLEEIQRNFEGYNEGVRRVLLKRNTEGQFGEIYGTVADVIETDPRYQMAVGAILGEKLQYVVVKSQEAGLEAVEYLKQEAVGRSSFVPLELRAHSEDPHFPAAGEAGVVGPLREFVQMKSDYQAVGEYLFRDVWLVETLNRAIQIWNSNGHKKTLVTLDGEVVDPFGVVSGGRLENQSHTLLEKKREIKDLVDQVRNLEGKARWQDEEVKKCERRIQTLMGSLDNLKKDSHGEELKILNLQKDIDHLQGEMTRLTQRRDALSIEIAAWMTEEQDLERELLEWGEKGGRAQEEKKEKEEKLIQLKLALEEEEKAFDQLKEEFTKRKLDSETIYEKKNLTLREVKRFLEAKTQISLRQEECLRLITQGNQQSALLRKEIAASEEALKVLLQEVGELNARLVALREAFDRHSNEVRSKELSLREVRKKHDEVKTEMNAFLVRLTELRNRLQFLKEQIFERYHTDLSLTAPEYENQPLEDRLATEQELAELKERLTKIGEVNVGAISEYEELKTRYDFLNAQSEDLKASLEALHRVIHKINRSTRKRFIETFEAVNQRFQELFPKLFQGGRAKLLLTDENNLLETGVEIVAQPPGKKLQSISLLSGGEKALTAVSLIFAIFLFKPSPFCLLDEVDAPLDDANIDRFNDLVRSMIDRSQFILITHNKRTMEMADVLYGITMQEAGISKTVSVKLD